MSGSPEKLLFADDLALVFSRGPEKETRSLKRSIEDKGSRVKVKKTKIIFRSENTGKVTEESKSPRAVC